MPLGKENKPLIREPKEDGHAEAGYYCHKEFLLGKGWFRSNGIEARSDTCMLAQSHNGSNMGVYCPELMSHGKKDLCPIFAWWNRLKSDEKLRDIAEDWRNKMYNKNRGRHRSK